MRKSSRRADAQCVSCCAALGAILIGTGCIDVWPEVEPRFTVSPESLTFEAAVNDESVPEQYLCVEDPDGVCGPITATADSAWVRVTPMMRLAYVGAPWTFSVGVTLDGLAEGTHTATITVRSDRDGAKVLVPMTLTISVQAEGYVAISTGPIIIPRELSVGFAEGMSDAEMEAVIAATGSTVVSHTSGSTAYGIETPLGYGLQEVMDDLLVHPTVSSCSPFQGNFCGLTQYQLMAEGGSGSLWPLAGDSGLLEEVVLEYIVRVRGHEIDMGYLDVTSVDILRDRVLEWHGTIALVDRGSGDVVVILVEDSGAAWELLGPQAEEIAALPGVDGKTATIHGCERPLSLTSRAGGLELRVTSYDLADSRPEQPCSGTDTFEAVGVVRPAPQKWVTDSGGRITHVLEGIGVGRTIVTGSQCNVHIEMIPEGAKLRLSAGSPHMADALVTSEGRRALISGELPHLRALWDSDGPVPPEGKVTDLQPLATSIEAYGDVVAGSSVASLWGEGTVPPGATHALVDWIEMPPQPWPPGYYPELPPYPFIVHYFLRPTARVPDLSACEGLTVSVEGDLLGVGDNLTVGPRVISVSAIAELSEPLPDRISGAVGEVRSTSSAYLLKVNDLVTEYYLAADSPVDPAGLVGTWVRVSGEVTGGYGSTAGQPAVSVLTLSVDAADAMPAEFDGRDQVRLSGRIATADGFNPSTATHNLIKDAGPMLPAFWTAAHLRSEQAGLLGQWENCGSLFVEGTVDSWITWEGDESFGTLVNVTAVSASCPSLEGVWLVDADAPPGGDGRTWATAFQHPQDAVDAALAGNEVWVAEGTYTRRDAADSVLLLMKDGVALYGGFAGTETSRDARDWTAQESILDGEGACCHVVIGASTARLDGFTVAGGNAVGECPDYSGGGMHNYSVRSLTVVNCTFAGNSATSGGGMFNFRADVDVTNCTFRGNSAHYGGGMANSTCSLSVNNCTFTGNSATAQGGAISNASSTSPLVTGCTFTGNSAKDGGGIYSGACSRMNVTGCVFRGNSARCGGAMMNDKASPRVVECTFTGNSASGSGAVANRGFSPGSTAVCSPRFENCVFAGNSAQGGGAMGGSSYSCPVAVNCTFTNNSASSGSGISLGYYACIELTNCILWGKRVFDGPQIAKAEECTVTVRFSCVQGGYEGEGNIDADPLFLDPGHWDDSGTPNHFQDDSWVDGDYRLRTGSPCIDAGTSVDAPNHDLDGKERPLGAAVDMGAYECSSSVCAAVWFVDDDASVGGDGLSWATALQHPQDAVDAASAGEEVWVAEGLYARRDSADTVLLAMKGGVAIYGGFAGTETSRDGREPAVHETILDGEDATDHVVAGASDGRLDGFTVTGGNANEGVRPNYNGGGGMRNESVTDLTVANCRFADNSGLLGGGMYNESSSLAVTGCVFAGNSAAIHGGGMDNYYCSSLEIVNCTFTGNSAFWDGGGMRSYASSLAVTNCTFADNSAGSGGGMLNCGGSSADVVNCILWGNAAPNGPEVYNDAFTSVSCVLTYSCIGQDGYTGNPDDHNINADPLFVDAASGDFHLQATSPCVDAGTTDGAPDHDLDGNARPFGQAVDMGAYEWSSSCSNAIWFVHAGASSGGDGLTWATAFAHPQDAVDAASAEDEIWVAQGTYARRDLSDTILLVMQPGISLYGGFAGAETSREERDPAACVATLDGEYLCHRVVIGASDARFDGFTVTGGNTFIDEAADRIGGGGMWNNDVSGLVIESCAFTGNYASLGGGMRNDKSSVEITNCLFSENTSNSGGGMFNAGGSPTITSCTFAGNSAVDIVNTGGFVGPGETIGMRFFLHPGGGGIYNARSPAMIRNCVFRGNKAVGYSGLRGGGVFNNYCEPEITNCTFASNEASFNCGALANYHCGPTITNCIMWGNISDWHPEMLPAEMFPDHAVVTYSDIQGGYPGVGNIDADPLFVDPANGDLRLSASSPCIDAADGNAAPEADKDGAPRYDDLEADNGGAGDPDFADMGAYEFQGSEALDDLAAAFGCVPAAASQAAPSFAVCVFVACIAMRLRRSSSVFSRRLPACRRAGIPSLHARTGYDTGAHEHQP